MSKSSFFSRFFFSTPPEKDLERLPFTPLIWTFRPNGSPLQANLALSFRCSYDLPPLCLLAFFGPRPPLSSLFVETRPFPFLLFRNVFFQLACLLPSSLKHSSFFLTIRRPPCINTQLRLFFFTRPSSPPSFRDKFASQKFCIQVSPLRPDQYRRFPSLPLDSASSA